MNVAKPKNIWGEWINTGDLVMTVSSRTLMLVIATSFVRDNIHGCALVVPCYDEAYGWLNAQWLEKV